MGRPQRQPASSKKFDNGNTGKTYFRVMKNSPGRSQIFRQRLASSLALWAVVLAVLLAPHPAVANLAFLLILSFLGVFGIREYACLLSKTGTRVSSSPILAAGLSLLLLSVLQGWRPFALPIFLRLPNPEIWILTLLLLWLLSSQLWMGRGISFLSMAGSLFGWLYVFWLLSFLAKIYYHPAMNGSQLLLYFLLVTKFSDLGAYVVGSLCGRHKMTPFASPGKTWEGFAGALAISTAASVLTVYIAGNELAPFRGIHCVVLGILLGGFAVVGDLAESLLKREAGAKNSGAFFPGIGGCLDLIDSLLFNAPLFYLYCQLAMAV